MFCPDYEDFRSFWGKARPDASARFAFHPVWAHGLDVAAAGRSLVRARSRAFRAIATRLGWRVDDLERFWLHLLALHDIGKFSPLFQSKVPHLYPVILPPLNEVMRSRADPGHPLAGLLYVAGWLQDDRGERPTPLMLGWGWKVSNRVLQPIFGHHGRPVPVSDTDWRSLFSPDKAADAALSYWRAAEELLPAPELSAPGSATVAEVSWAIAGLTTLADWIGSNQSWFPYEPPETDLATYWDKARRRADHAVREAGLLPARAGPRLAFATLTDLPHRPTAAQAWADGVPLADGPLLAIVEDVTGGGKTEAALMLAHRLLVEGRADGLYFALPTMATANAMFDRIAAIAPRLYADATAPSLALAHRRAGLHPRFRHAVSGFPEPSGARDEDSATIAPAWLASESRKALLADLGVGTIDQAVLAVLPNRYGSMRLAGLAGKVLIVDEAHGYDAYVGAELERLVAFHAAGGGSTIILSATLPSVVKHRIVEAWRGALGQPSMRLAATAYPLATFVAPCRPPVEAPLAARADLARTLAVTRVPDVAAALARIRAAVAAGACVVWVRNTVDDAIEGAAALRDAGVETDLFHARFTTGDRIAIEQRVLKRFGKRSTVEVRHGQALVATQVVEQSLDLDFDLVVSDLAPIDSILQRAGRLWRHTARPRPIAGPELVVVAPDSAAPIAADWFKSAFPRAAFVYADHAILCRTARELAARPAFRVPEDVRAAIEAVYDADEADIAPALVPVHHTVVGKTGAERSIAHQTLLVFAEGYRPDGKGWSEERAAPTRLAEASRLLRLARLESGRLVPWHDDANPRRAWALSEVTAYERKLGGRHDPEPRWRLQVEAARKDWSRFEDDVILLPLEGRADDFWRGVLIDCSGRRLELRYSTSSGLAFGPL